MSRRPKLPYDIRQECLWIVRGYDRRVRAYHEARREIIDGTACVFSDKKNGDRVYLPHSGGCGRPSENKAEQLQAIEMWPETKKMRAVEHAKIQIGLDLENQDLRQRLTDGIILNCVNRNEYPFRLLNLPDMSERDFYRRKDRFLVDIAIFLGML